MKSRYDFRLQRKRLGDKVFTPTKVVQFCPTSKWWKTEENSSTIFLVRPMGILPYCDIMEMSMIKKYKLKEEEAIYHLL